MTDVDVPLALYGRRVEVAVDGLPSAGPFDHTMAHDLDDYVTQRVPTAPVHEALAKRGRIEVHGVYPAHLPAVAARIGRGPVEPLGACELPGKTLNGVRPHLFWGRDAFGEGLLLVATPPGHDYVLHYASLILYLARQSTRHAEDRVRVWRYPDAERSVAQWTGLDTSVLRGANTVVFGKVELLCEALPRRGHELDRCVTPFYSCWTYTHGDRRVALLGVHFSYWGSIGGYLAARCAALGAEEILYVGKLGALTTPADIYGRLFVPSRYAVLHQLRVHAATSGPPNGLLERMPGLDTGLHVSVPTVMEEDYRQREVAAVLGAASIDNELAQMAVAVDEWNRRNDRTVRFSALHYASDYLRRADEVGWQVPFSLARGRTQDARRRRQAAELLVGDCLQDYLGSPRRARAVSIPAPLRLAVGS